jgi:hypothetical protein
MEKILREALKCIEVNETSVLYGYTYDLIKNDENGKYETYINNDECIGLKFNRKTEDGLNRYTIVLVQYYIFGLINDKHHLIQYDEDITLIDIKNKSDKVFSTVNQCFEKLYRIITSRRLLDSEVKKFWISL